MERTRDSAELYKTRTKKIKQMTHVRLAKFNETNAEELSALKSSQKKQCVDYMNALMKIDGKIYEDEVEIYRIFKENI
jgi:hypothetical protein